MVQQANAQPVGRRRRSQRTDALNVGRRLRLSAIGAITMVCACATSRSSLSKPAPVLAQSESHIYVTGEGLNGDCYKDLGQVSLSESYAQSVVESPDSQAQRLRQLARESYAAGVDAIINVRKRQNEAGTGVEITGEAVHVQNHETVACTARMMPAVVDTAGTAAAGGIVGTVIGGLLGTGSGVYGAEAGGAMGAAAGAGAEIAKHQQEERAQETFIGDRLEQQRKEIAQLYQQLSKLIGQQCDSEELSEQDCEKRITAVQQQIAETKGPAQASAPSSKAGTSASAGPTTEFGLLNRIQEQQEIIDQLQQRIAQSKQSGDNR